MLRADTTTFSVYTRLSSATSVSASTVYRNTVLPIENVIDQVSIYRWFTVYNAGPTLNQHWPNVDSVLGFTHSTLTISMLSHRANAIYGVYSWDHDNSPFNIAL